MTVSRPLRRRGHALAARSEPRAPFIARARASSPVWQENRGGRRYRSCARAGPAAGFRAERRFEAPRRSKFHVANQTSNSDRKRDAARDRRRRVDEHVGFDWQATLPMTPKAVTDRDTPRDHRKTNASPSTASRAQAPARDHSIGSRVPARCAHHAGTRGRDTRIARRPRSSTGLRVPSQAGTERERAGHLTRYLTRLPLTQSTDTVPDWIALSRKCDLVLDHLTNVVHLPAIMLRTGLQSSFGYRGCDTKRTCAHVEMLAQGPIM